MRLQLLSDLHLEFHRDRGRAFLDTLRPDGVDAVVLAGDTATRELLPGAIGALCARYPKVLLVAGNHEYYHASPDEVHATLSRLEDAHPGFTWLRAPTPPHEGRLVELGGHRVVGATLWFPPAPGVPRAINDFRLIRGFEPWVYAQHERDVAWLTEHLPSASAVVTHHIPSRGAVSERFAASPLNAFFHVDLDALILACDPPVWLFGHTHDRVDQVLGRTRLLANPLGYPSEAGDPLRGPYRPTLHVELTGG